MSQAPTQDDLEPLRAALLAAHRPFVAYGDIPVTDPIKLLVSRNATGVIFPPPSPESLTPLLEACHQASFGRGGQDVLDPTYRRALVLHGKAFGVAPATALDPYALGIISALEAALLSEGIQHNRHVTYRIDKLNVYREGDFFKTHVDTPRAANMFGTLLINLPVEHTGGQLVVRPPVGGERALAEKQGVELVQSFETKWGGTDNLSWVAFFSDCSHEVLPVLSGHRVALTYNLFLEDMKTGNTSEIEMAKSASGVVLLLLEKALNAPGLFTKERPRVCFHLQHQYPVDISDTVAESVIPILKGRDIVLYRSLVRAGLAASFHFIIDIRTNSKYYQESETNPDPMWILPPRGRLPSDDLAEEGIEELLERANARHLSDFNIVEVEPVPEDKAAAEERYHRHLTHQYVSKYENGGKTRWPFDWLAYGNEASVATCYASLCIVASRKGDEVTTIWPKSTHRDARYVLHPSGKLF